MPGRCHVLADVNEYIDVCRTLSELAGLQLHCVTEHKRVALRGYTVLPTTPCTSLPASINYNNSFESLPTTALCTQIKHARAY